MEVKYPLILDLLTIMSCKFGIGYLNQLLGISSFLKVAFLLFPPLFALQNYFSFHTRFYHFIQIFDLQYYVILPVEFLLPINFYSLQHFLSALEDFDVIQL